MGKINSSTGEDLYLIAHDDNRVYIQNGNTIIDTTKLVSNGQSYTKYEIDSIVDDIYNSRTDINLDDYYNREEMNIIIDNINQTSSNVGDGEGLALPKDGSDLPFKSLKVSGNATIESDEDSITINVQEGDTGEVNTSSNVGSGEGLALPKDGSDLPFKSLKASGIATIESDEDSVTINVQGGSTVSNPLEGLDTTQDATGAAGGYRKFGSLSKDSSNWIGGVLAPNGKIYGIPYSSPQVLEIDPVTQTTTLFGSLDYSWKWAGGVLAPNGKIYGIPHGATQVIEIDPVTQTTTLFGSLSAEGYKWYGGVLAPNGKIYGIPYDSTQVLEIDPVNRTTTLFGSFNGYGKWYGGVLAPNGKIYGIPFESTQVLEIDPVTQTTTLFGSLSGYSHKWAGGVLAPNGKIYGIPHMTTQVLEIDPDTQTTTLFGSLSGSYKWNGGVLAPNGKIYGIPYDSTQVLEIDPVNRTTTLFGSLSGSYKWYGGVLAPNGKIYGIPHNSPQVIEISKGMNGGNYWALSAYVNKF